MAITITTSNSEGSLVEETPTRAPTQRAETNQSSASDDVIDDELETTDDSAKSEDTKANQDEDDLDYLNKKDEDEDTDDDEDDEEDDDEIEQPVKKTGFKKRIDKLTSRNTSLQYRIAELEAKINGVSTPRQNTETQQPQSETLKEPNFDDFETVAEYSKALVKYETKLMLQQEKEAAQNQEYENQALKIKKAWDLKVEEASKKYKDWGEVQKATHVPLTTFIRAEIMKSEIGPDVVYYLYKHQDKANKIADMSPGDQIFEIKTIENKIKQRLGQTKSTTTAPTPVNSIKKSNANGSTKKSIEDMNYREYRAHALSKKKNS